MKRMLAVAGIMLASAGVVIATPASASDHTPAPCSLEQVVKARVAQLPATVPFRIGDTPNAMALTYDDEVVVSRETPCDIDLITSIVNHEWVHTKQYQVFGTHYAMKKVYGAKGVEKIADCGSLLLGSRDTPYIDQYGPCTDDELMVARDLIALPANTHM